MHSTVNRVSLAIVLSAAVFLWSSRAAHAQSDASTDVVSLDEDTPVSQAPQHERHGYAGWLAASYALTPLMISGTGFVDYFQLKPAETLDEVFIVAAALSILTPSLTHWLNGQPSRGVSASWRPWVIAAAFGIGVGVLGLAGGAADSAGGVDDSTFTYAGIGFLVGASAGWLGWVVYDVSDTYRHIDRAPAETTELSFALAPTRDGAMGALRGTF
jgi:hypothetical protein